jgi:hypothetical protein
MRAFIVVACFVLLGFTSAQTQSASLQPAPEQKADQQKAAPPAPDSAVEQSQIDPAKAADIRQLMSVGGTKAIMTQMMDTLGDNIRPMMTSALPPGDYREKLIDLFFQKFKSKADLQQLLDSIAPLYDEYLSDEEIKGLIRFYQTPLGQKTVQVMPKLVAGSQERGRKWGEALGRQSMLEVLSEHPELKKELEDAGKSPPAQ